jgi:hypothetical protein
MVIYRLQETELKGLLERLYNFEKSGQGKIYNIEIMTNSDFQGDVFVSYELADNLSAEPVRQSNMYQITKDGKLVNFITNFNNPFEKYAFLGRCLVQNIETIEVIDN